MLCRASCLIDPARSLFFFFPTHLLISATEKKWHSWLSWILKCDRVMYSFCDWPGAIEKSRQPPSMESRQSKDAIILKCKAVTAMCKPLNRLQQAGLLPLHVPAQCKGKGNNISASNSLPFRWRCSIIRLQPDAPITHSSPKTYREWYIARLK